MYNSVSPDNFLFHICTVYTLQRFCRILVIVCCRKLCFFLVFINFFFVILGFEQSSTTKVLDIWEQVCLKNLNLKENVYFSLNGFKRILIFDIWQGFEQSSSKGLSWLFDNKCVWIWTWKKMFNFSLNGLFCEDFNNHRQMVFTGQIVSFSQQLNICLEGLNNHHQKVSDTWE